MVGGVCEVGGLVPSPSPPTRRHVCRPGPRPRLSAVTWTQSPLSRPANRDTNGTQAKRPGSETISPKHPSQITAKHLRDRTLLKQGQEVKVTATQHSMSTGGVPWKLNFGVSFFRGYKATTSPAGGSSGKLSSVCSGRTCFPWLKPDGARAGYHMVWGLTLYGPQP